MGDAGDTKWRDFEHITTGIQAIVVAGAVLIGGAWTLYTFGALHEKTRAEAETQDLQRKLAGEPTIKGAIDFSQVSGRTKMHRILLVRVSLTNTGTRGVVLDLREHPLRLTRLAMRTPERPSAEHTFQVDSFIEVDNKGGLMKTRLLHLRGQSTETLSYVVEVDEPGIYMATFASAAGPIESGEFADDAIRSGVRGITSRKDFSMMMHEPAPRGYHNADDVIWTTTGLLVVH